jgi:DNA modification methylase
LHEDPENPNEHDDASIKALAEILTDYGQKKNIVADASGKIIAGNGTWRAAKSLGWTHITIGPAPADENDAKAYGLADNRSAELSQRNNARVGSTLAALGKAGHDISRLGWNGSERNSLLALASSQPLAQKSAADEAEDDEVIPEPSREVVTKIGDVWKLGDHVLVCGDSFSLDVRTRVLGDHKADAIVTDPPYAIYGSSTGIGADIADDRMVRPFFENAFKVFLASTKAFGHVYVCCDWRSYAAVTAGSAAARTGGAYGLWQKNLLVWDKGHGLGSMYVQCHEFIAFYTVTPTPKAMKSTTKETGQRMVMKKNVFAHERAHGDDRQHNAAKPPPLFKWLIENSTDKGELVVDFFGGSGTTIVAAERLERRAVVFEVKPENCDIVIARWEKIAGAKAKRLRNAA